MGKVLAKKGNRLTSGDKLTAWLLRWSPLLVFLAVTLPVPAYFFMRYLAASVNPGEELLFALTSLGVLSVFGAVAAALVYL